MIDSASPQSRSLNTHLKRYCASAVAFALTIQMLTFSVPAQSLSKVEHETLNDDREEISAPHKNKISPDLEEKSDDLESGLRADETQKVIIRLKSETDLDEMLGNSFSQTEQKQIFAEEARHNKAKAGILMTDLWL